MLLCVANNFSYHFPMSVHAFQQWISEYLVVVLEVFLEQARRNCGIDNYGRASQTNHQRVVKMDLVEESLFFKYYVAAWL